MCAVSNETLQATIPTCTSNVVISVLIGIFLVVGSAGNILTILVISANKKLHSISNIFIISLCISDLISGLVCSPLWLYRRTWGFDMWFWGEFLCKFYWVIDFATNYATSLHIVSFAALRFIAVKWPFRVTIFTKRRVFIYISFLWGASLVASLPLTHLMGVVKNRGQLELGSSWPSCSIYNNQNLTGKNEIVTCCVQQYNIYMSVTSAIIFYLPEACVIILSCCIAKVILRQRRWRRSVSNVYRIKVNTKLNQSEMTCKNLPDVVANTHAIESQENSSDDASEDGSRDVSPTDSTSSPSRQTTIVRNRIPRNSAREIQHQRERKTFTQLSLIVLAFMLGYIPMTVYLMWTTVPVAPKSQISLDYWFGVASYLCLRLSECMNPVMYNLGSSNIRRASVKYLSDLRIFKIRWRRPS